MKRKIYIASHNPKKVAELTHMLTDSSYELLTATELNPDVTWHEDADTFIGNARIKANAIKRFTSAAVLADDSGLIVPALDGEPGVFSARYSGPKATDVSNNAKLVQELMKRRIDWTPAYYVCCLVFADEKERESIFIGTWHGQIQRIPEGENGFGYDPYFFLPEHGKTVAQLPDDLKNKFSHRAQALQRWLHYVNNNYFIDAGAGLGADAGG